MNFHRRDAEMRSVDRQVTLIAPACNAVAWRRRGASEVEASAEARSDRGLAFCKFHSSKSGADSDFVIAQAGRPGIDCEIARFPDRSPAFRPGLSKITAKIIAISQRFIFGILCTCLLVTTAIAADKQPPAQDTVSVDPQTALVIRGALKYLATHQAANGSFARNEHQGAFTGYALIAFMASGELPNEGEFGKNVANGMSFLLDCERPDGFIAARTGGGNMYGHGIATIALAELYGQTSDPAIKPKLEAAVHLIVSSQGKEGGWRYAPKINPDADISVTVLQVVALRAAKNAGLKVPQETLDHAIAFVKNCHDTRTGGFSYQPHSEAGFARTAAALYSLQVCGLYDDPYVAPASDYLIQKFGKSPQWFSYGNFYAAPAQYMIGGETWTKWYALIHERLMSTAKQLPDGMYYWESPPGDNPNNPTYATSVAAMILAMPYHYLPLYQR